MLNVQRLRILSELHRRGTLAEVARALNYSPSAVSQQLAQLERETGVVLLERVGRRVRLTDAALELVGHAAAILERMEQAEARLAIARPAGPSLLRLASFQTVLLSIAPPALTVLARRHPQLEVQIHQREVEAAVQGLLAHHFDMILGEDYPGLRGPLHEGVDREDLLADPILLVLPQSGSWAGIERLGDLADAGWALDPADTLTGIWARSMLRRAGIEPRVRVESPDPLLQAHLVRSGHAVALIPALIAAQHLGGTRLWRLPGDPHRRLSTAIRAGRQDHPAIRAVREALAEAARAEAPMLPPRIPL